MAAKIGILGETTVVTSGTLTTVYTVPADKAARVRVLFGMEGGGGYSFDMLIGPVGSERTLAMNPAGGNNDLWTGILLESTADPLLSHVAKSAGIQELDGGLADLDGSSDADFVITPLTFDYFLSTGDTVKCRVNTASAVDLIFQVMGVEDDA